jgi:hypothetical protein
MDLLARPRRVCGGERRRTISGGSVQFVAVDEQDVVAATRAASSRYVSPYLRRPYTIASIAPGWSSAMKRSSADHSKSRSKISTG